MLRIILAGAVAFAALVLSLQPAGAAEAPWCAVTSGGDGDMHWDCHYRSIEECLPNVLAGNRGCAIRAHTSSLPRDIRIPAVLCVRNKVSK
jgi:hypothetical protein